MQDEPWNLSVYSDLDQDSELYNRALSESQGEDDAAVVLAMLSICSPPRIAPNQIRINSWPGIIRNRGAVREHQENRQLFEAFFKAWAPEATIKIESIR